MYCLLLVSSSFRLFSSFSSCSFSVSSSSGASVGKKDGKNDGPRSIYIHSSNIHFNYIMKLPNQLDPASQVSPFFGFGGFEFYFFIYIGVFPYNARVHFYSSVLGHLQHPAVALRTLTAQLQSEYQIATHYYHDTVDTRFGERSLANEWLRLARRIARDRFRAASTPTPEQARTTFRSLPYY